MNATEILKNEHRLIEKVISSLKTICKDIQDGKDIPKETLKKIIDFIRMFADKYHHKKEEDRLFVIAEKHGIPRDDGPVSVMLNEHDMGRNYVKQFDEAVDKGDKSAITENALAFAALLTDHIYKEDNILYPMIDSALSEDAQKEMLVKFKEVEKKEIQEKYSKFAEEIYAKNV